MRFRKTISLGKGLKLNLSKSGISATAGVKGLSVNIGENGAYLNTGIPGSGLYDRRKIGGGVNNVENVLNETEDEGYVPPYKPFNGVISFFCFIIGLPCALLGLLGVAAYVLTPNSSDSEIYLKFFVITLIIGVVLFPLHCINHNKAKKNDRAKKEYLETIKAKYDKAMQRLTEARREILEAKENTIKENEFFKDCKIFTIDYNNIIAFSPERCIAIFTNGNTDVMKIIWLNHINKITHEIKSGACYAHIFTDDFKDNVIDLYLGEAHNQDETERIKNLYNEIKNMYSLLKKQKGAVNE
ncbi:MAG: DUF4236 domain-containing protein [Spirochaetaceae bacterium]|jgi:hypothetical protein|nr:DUF4236 domain-containing protein [Spirochaetaceae bacterium]